MRTALASLLTVGLALLAGIAATPRDACACSTKAPMFLSLPRDLDRIAELQGEFFADSGRFASRESLEGYGWIFGSPMAEFKTVVASDSLFQAVVWMPSLSAEVTCTLTMRADGTPPERTCVNLPERGKRGRRAALLYVVVVLAAIALRVALAGRTQPPVDLGTVGRLAFPFLVHPFWIIVPAPSWCEEYVGLGYLWIGFPAAYILRLLLFRRYEPPPPPRGPQSRAGAPAPTLP